MDDIDSLAANESSVSLADVMDFYHNQSVTSVSKGLLVVPKDGDYSFEISGKSSQVRLYMSDDSHAENKVCFDLILTLHT